MASGVIAAGVVICALIMNACSGPQDNKPNVLLIAVDDLNDWIGCMGGHPQAKTPNMDGLLQRECSLPMPTASLRYAIPPVPA